MMSGKVSYHAGLAAEMLVARHYCDNDHSVAASRWRGQAGEIDLVLRKNDQVIFVEVKKSKTHAAAVARLQRRQIERIYAAAGEFLANEPRGQLTDVRFDVATVDQTGAVQILENAIFLA